MRTRERIVPNHILAVFLATLGSGVATAAACWYALELFTGSDPELRGFPVLVSVTVLYFGLLPSFIYALVCVFVVRGAGASRPRASVGSLVAMGMGCLLCIFGFGKPFAALAMTYAMCAPVIVACGVGMNVAWRLKEKEFARCEPSEYENWPKWG